MKRIGFGALLLVGLIVVVGLLHGTQPAGAQNQEGRGWIEGVAVNEKGDPVQAAGYTTYGATITVRPAEGDGLHVDCDMLKGGFYTFRNLKPGVYEVLVDKTSLRDSKYRPQHIFGLVVEPDKRTLLNITVHEGDAIEEVGKPNVATQKAIIISDELAKLQQQIDELKRK